MLDIDAWKLYTKISSLMSQDRKFMSYDENELERLRQENDKLRAELENERRKDTPQINSAVVETPELPVSLSEYQTALKRLMQRTAMIVQSEKCVVMVQDKESGDLIARSPAWGLNDEQVFAFRVPVGEGFSGEVFRTGHSRILENAVHDRRAAVENLREYGIKNGICVPLVVEKHDENNRVVDRSIFGVIHCFNKRKGEGFVEEDVRLLERLAKSAAAVIANAQLYQEMAEDKQKLVQTIDSLSSGLILINSRGRIAQMNNQARKIFNINPEEDLTDRVYTDVIHHEQCLEILKQCIEDCSNPADKKAPKLDNEGEIIRDPDEITVVSEEEEQLIYQIQAAGVRDASHNIFGVVFILNDITELRNVERMKTEFVSIVAHELRTPLTPIKGFVRTLLDDEKEEWYQPEDRREFYTIIDTNVDRLSRMINDLLNVSRIERGAGIEMNWQQADIRLACESVLTTQKGRSDKHVLVLDLEPENFTAESDPDILQNILQNFVSNAIKYSDGGEVRIIGRLEPATEAFPDGSVLMGVKDEGVGLTESEIKKIGEKFFRSDNKKARSAGGTGLGLFLVKSLIAAHGGTMWVESEVGKGSTFWFRFPAKQHVPEETVQA